MLKKISFALCLMLAASAVFAGIQAVEGYDAETAVYYQFTHELPSHTGSYIETANTEQPWPKAQKIQLTVGGPCDVWVSNYVSSWYWPKPLDPLDGNVFDMGATQYGAYQLNGDKVWVGTGETTEVTYVDDESGLTNSTTAYFVGSFEGGETVSIWMTTLPEDGGETVDMQQLVQDANNDPTLVSRGIDIHDLAGNVRVNFGIDSASFGNLAREFVAFGVTDGNHSKGGSSGQPLPGVMATGLLAMGTIAAAKKMKKRA